MIATETMTPGPWEPVALGSEGYAVMGPPQEGRLGRRRVARCGDTDWDQDKANAEVIAATPELLALVRDLVAADDCGVLVEGALRAVAVIARARVLLDRLDGRVPA